MSAAKSWFKYAWFRYTFTLDDGRQRTLEVNLDPQTFDLVPAPAGEKDTLPAWTELAYSKCGGCALPPEAKHCPVAVNLVPFIETLRDVASAAAVEVVVETPERQYFKKGSPQQLLFPLLAVYMTASGCPTMGKLKPLVGQHLPFSTIDEMTFRVLTMYVMAQYLRMQDGLEPDWELKGIGELFDQVNQANVAFCQRLSKLAGGEDGVVNALVVFDMVGSFVRMPRQEVVAMIRGLFQAYLAK